ncbi:MAG: response regulator [Phenylobacterium sp.]|uniref:response regulator n=1 Tax=Phenylobacterium sp. TaxID=1871053 RepID=UPI0025D63856|nr:response regulator [Phenylobacterium sp.]MBI1200409.1 response regulator [Phenylobacterium sp.]
MNASSPADVLIVEDNAEDLELVLREFADHGLTDRIDVVRDGDEALDYLFCCGAYGGRPRGADPRMILLDLKLPKLDGLEILRRIRGHARLQTVPVVVLTSSFRDADIVESYGLGATTYLVKPVDAEAFTEIVRRIAQMVVVQRTGESKEAS